MSRTARPSRILRNDAPAALAVILAVWTLYLVNPNQHPLGDTAAALPVATSMVNHGDLKLDEYRAAPGFTTGGWVTERADGHLVGYFPWAVAVAGIPAVVVVNAAHAVGLAPSAETVVFAMGAGHARLQNIVGAWWTAVAVGGVFVLARRRLHRDTLRAAAVAAVFAFGTSAWSTAAFQLWQHGPSLACIAWSLVAIDRWLHVPASRRRQTAEAVGLGALVAASYAIRPTNALTVIAVTMWIVTRVAAGERRRPLAFAFGAASVAAPWFAITHATYGSWFQPYNQAGRIGWHDAFGQALLANLISPGRGLLVFSPVLIVSLVGVVKMLQHPRRADGLMWLSLAVVVAHWLVIAGFDRWFAGHSYGPRLFTDVLPYLFVLGFGVIGRIGERNAAGHWSWATVAVASLSIVSIALHAPATLIASTGCWNVHPVNVDADPSRVWDWHDPLFVAGYRDLLTDPGAAWRGGCPRA